MTMAPTTYKLYYFNVKALAEPIRFLFAYGGLPYEDIRIERSDWPSIKETMPMGHMPVLEVDGKKVSESIAIARYVAHKVGLSGSNDWENLLIDSVVDTIIDLRQKMLAVFMESDENVKQTKKATLTTETFPFYFSKLEEIAKENNGHLVASKFTWADFIFAAMLELMKIMEGEDIIDKYPNLQKVANNVYSLDSIKTWMENRPVTQH